MSELLEVFLPAIVKPEDPEYRKSVEDRSVATTEVCDWVVESDENTSFLVTASEPETTRKSLQNRLMWRWNKDTGKHYGWSANYAHGWNKLNILLPLRLSWGSTYKRAMGERAVADALIQNVSYEWAVFNSIDNIRSKDLSVREFAEYLTQMQRYHGEHGCSLFTREDELFFLLMK